ncbi:uncharacterized protein LOC117119946 [Anneissia japonica]|uniref:uncharacterized protein LOC117119946 n=1 Tax=Anneissia japonica TaxID=1529436 RepID=UPI0014259754|nr:uncharacterized protein LOC117119946 [Anneissia japonica]
MLYGLTYDELRILAYEYAESNGIRHPFNRDTKKAGQDWISGFMKRHQRPCLSLTTTAIHITTPLKVYYELECHKWMTSNAGKQITQYEVGELFAAAYFRCASVGKAAKAFECTGIYPFNPDIFTNIDFAPSEVTEREYPHTDPAEHQEDPVEHQEDPENLRQTLQSRANQTKEKGISVTTKEIRPNEEYRCIFCSEKYEEPLTEDWIMCMACKQWCHEACAYLDMEGHFNV